MCFPQFKIIDMIHRCPSIIVYSRFVAREEVLVHSGCPILISFWVMNLVPVFSQTVSLPVPPTNCWFSINRYRIPIGCES